MAADNSATPRRKHPIMIRTIKARISVGILTTAIGGIIVVLFEYGVFRPLPLTAIKSLFINSTVDPDSTVRYVPYDRPLRVLELRLIEHQTLLADVDRQVSAIFKVEDITAKRIFLIQIDNLAPALAQSNTAKMRSALHAGYDVVVRIEAPRYNGGGRPYGAFEGVTQTVGLTGEIIYELYDFNLFKVDTLIEVVGKKHGRIPANRLLHRTADAAGEGQWRSATPWSFLI